MDEVRSTGSRDREIVEEDDETSSTPTIPLKKGTGRHAAVYATSSTSRTPRITEAVTSTRSSYRRTSSRYTTKGRRSKKVLIGLGIFVAVVAILGGAVLAIAHWSGVIKPSTEGGDTTIIPLRMRGKEAELPLINVDTLIRALNDVDGSSDDLVVFSTTKKDFLISDEQQAILEAAVARVQAILKPEAERQDPADVPEPVADDGVDTEEGAEGDDGEIGEVDTANVAFFAIDLEQGRGIAYNLDSYVQGGQSIKVLFAAFFASQFVDTAKATVEVEGKQVATSLDDNQDALYERLRRTYDEYGWDAWIGGVGAKSCVSASGYYPMLTARMEAKAWLNLYKYITSGTYGATWLASLIEGGPNTLTGQALSTERAIILLDGGEAAIISPIGASATVWSFGGRQNDQDGGTSCVVENAIVLVDGHSYVICVLTGLADSAGHRDLVADIIAACANAIIPPVTSAEDGQ